MITLSFIIYHLSFSDAVAQVRHYTVSDGLQTNEVRQVIELPNGQVLVNSEGAFGLFDGQSFRAIPLDRSKTYRLSQYTGYAHLWQGDSLLWLRDFYRLYLFDARTRSFRYDVEHRLKDDRVARIAEGQDTYSTPEEHWQQLADSIGAASKVAHVMRDRQGGTWIGTQNNGLFYMPPQRPQAMTLNDEQLERMAYGTTDSQGRTWQCRTEGLYCYKGDSVTRYTQDNVQGFIHNRMLFITELPDGRLLLCNHARCLGYFNPETATFRPIETVREQLFEDYRLLPGASLTADRQRVLVYAQNGAFLLNTHDDSIEEFTPARNISQWSDKYNCAVTDSRGQLWVGTQNGLFRIAQGSTTRTAGLANNCIRSIIEDDNGNIWVGTAAGISRVRQSGTVTNFGPADGVPETSMYERAVCKRDDGSLVFAHSGGLTLLQPQWFDGKDEASPAPVIVRMEVNGQPANADSICTFTHDQNYLSLFFSTLNYASPEHTRYRYRLGGFDTSWLTSDDGHGLATARYNALPPGNYTFEAQAAVGDGQWGPLCRKSIIILPPWWLTWWAKMGYCLIGLIGLIGLIALYLRRKKAQLERENEAKVNHLFELREEARHQFAENVNIDPSKISINKEEEELVARLMKAIEKNMDNTDYTVDQLASDVALSRSNLYRRTQSMLGITPNDFLRNVRLKHAAHLLSETEIPVNQVSLQCGFASPRYFAQFFKKMFGVLPSEYRGKKDASGKHFFKVSHIYT